MLVQELEGGAASRLELLPLILPLLVLVRSEQSKRDSLFSCPLSQQLSQPALGLNGPTGQKMFVQKSQNATRKRNSLTNSVSYLILDKKLVASFKRNFSKIAILK